MDGIIFLIILLVVIGGLVFKTKSPDNYEKVKTHLQTYWENLRTYFK
jgi:hypothetical protein